MVGASNDVAGEQVVAERSLSAGQLASPSFYNELDLDFRGHVVDFARQSPLFQAAFSPSNTINELTDPIFSPGAQHTPLPHIHYESPDRVQPPPQENSPQSYTILQPLLPLLEGIVSSEAASELLLFYFSQPGSSLFRSASPYVMTHVLRKRSVLRSTHPRPTTLALLSVMLWVSAQTADIPILLLPGQRMKVCEALKKLCFRLVGQRDRDNWTRLADGSFAEISPSKTTAEGNDPGCNVSDRPVVDDVLSFVLICIVISGSDFKNDCLVWWDKAIRLSRVLQLNKMDRKSDDSSPSDALDESRKEPVTFEAQEEGRRVFWLLYCLDRHLALSYNSALSVQDNEIELFLPLPEDLWKSLDSAPKLPRTYGPPILVTGTGFFQWFLPLMALLGDVIRIHHRRLHPRLGVLEDGADVMLVEASLARCARSIAEVEHNFKTVGLDGAVPASELLSPASTEHTATSPGGQTSDASLKGRAQAQLVTAYSTFILHVLHVLLHGKWDAVSMLDNDDELPWIPSVAFAKAAQHAIAASEAVEHILRCDPELTFSPYLFGIYLLQDSFILLLFADRMPLVGVNASVEKACETIIRAHEVCVVTLSTEFQVSRGQPHSFPSKSEADHLQCRKVFAKSFDRHYIA